jgi:hypothetical protein
MLINHYNSLFLAFSHNFISPHFCIKYLKMPTMISVQITQTQEDNDNPTMAHPVLESYLDPPRFQSSSFRGHWYLKRQKLQLLSLHLISSGFLTTCVETPKFRATRNTLLLPNPIATRRKTRPTTPRRRLEKQNMMHMPNWMMATRTGEMLCCSIDFQQKSNLARGIKD